MTGAPAFNAPLDEADAWRRRAIEAEAQLAEANETLDAIRSGDVDAVVVGTEGGTRVYTLENADRPYRALIEQMQEGAVTLSAEGTILYCNKRFEALAGETRERIVGAPAGDFVQGDDGERLAALVAACGPSGAKIELLLASPAKPGGVPVHVSLVQLIDDGGGSSMVCGIVTDLSEQQAHTAQLSAANIRLMTEIAERERVEDALRQAQKMEAIGQLTGGVAHDFNNLLTIIRSSADLLRRHELTEERRRRYVDAISDTADRAARLTSQLLAFARRSALKPEVFDAAARVDAVADMVRTVVGARIVVTTLSDAEQVWVLADPSQFETAVVNIVVNARDAMDGEGRLAIVTGMAEHRLADSDAAPEPFVTVAITDTGCGIPADRLDRIFEPFFTSKDVGKGTGLGLSQVYGFARQSGGEVRVTSVEGEGSTFTLYLPLRDPPQAVVAPQRAREAAGPRPRGRVLVVEDNPQVGEFASSLLDDLGYTTTLVDDAIKALERIAADPHGFDTVFSDVIMPGMTGLELAELLRRDHPHLRVVLTSGYSQVLAQEGLHGYTLLQKPYSVEELSRILRDRRG